jgi:hypothetical protein
MQRHGLLLSYYSYRGMNQISGTLFAIRSQLEKSSSWRQAFAQLGSLSAVSTVPTQLSIHRLLAYTEPDSRTCMHVTEGLSLPWSTGCCASV